MTEGERLSSTTDTTCFGSIAERLIICNAIDNLLPKCAGYNAYPNQTTPIPTPLGIPFQPVNQCPSVKVPVNVDYPTSSKSNDELDGIELQVINKGSLHVLYIKEESSERMTVERYIGDTSKLEEDGAALHSNVDDTAAAKICQCRVCQNGKESSSRKSKKLRRLWKRIRHTKKALEAIKLNEKHNCAKETEIDQDNASSMDDENASQNCVSVYTDDSETDLNQNSRSRSSAKDMLIDTYLCSTEIDSTEENRLEAHAGQRYETSNKPLAGASAVQLADPNDVNLCKDNISKVGWYQTPVSDIEVRGPHYLVNKEKIPCPASLYELMRVDVFESQSHMLEIGKLVDLSAINLDYDDHDPHDLATKTWKAPDIFLISLALPTETSTIMGRDSEAGYILTGYYRMRKETRQILQFISEPTYDANRDDVILREKLKDEKLKQMINGVKLWEFWCRNAPFNPEIQGRLKFIARGDNLREVGCPKWIRNYNGRPLLIKRAGKTGFLFSYANTMEFDLNLHAFPHLFKSAVTYLKDNLFSKMLMTFSFVIEGRTEDELPELLIGNGLKVCFMNPKMMPQAKDIFEGSKDHGDG